MYIEIFKDPVEIKDHDIVLKIFRHTSGEDLEVTTEICGREMDKPVVWLIYGRESNFKYVAFPGILAFDFHGEFINADN